MRLLRKVWLLRKIAETIDEAVYPGDQPGDRSVAVLKLVLLVGFLCAWIAFILLVVTGVLPVPWGET